MSTAAITRAPAAICGRSDAAASLGFDPTRLGGCGEEIATCAEVFRCVDCEVPFHRGCARRHFATSDEKDRLIAKREEKIIELMDRIADIQRGAPP